MNSLVKFSIGILVAANIASLAMLGYIIRQQDEFDVALHLISSQVAAVRTNGPMPAPLAVAEGRSEAETSMKEGKRLLATGNVRAAALYFRNALGHASEDNECTEKICRGGAGLVQSASGVWRL